MLASSWIASLLLVGLAPATSASTAGCNEPVSLASATLTLAPLAQDPPLPPIESPDLGPSVAIPHEAGHRLPDRKGVVAWYAFRIGPEEPGQVCALYIRHVHPNVVVYLNGSWIGQGGRFTPPEGHLWNRPLLFPFDAARLSMPSNLLMVGIPLNGSRYNSIGSVVLGLERDLRSQFEAALFVQIRLAEFSTLLSVFLFLLFGALAFSVRDAAYRWFALVAGFYGVSSLDFHWSNPPISNWTFELMCNLCVEWTCCSLSLLGLEILGMRRRMVEIPLLAFAGVVTCVATVMGGDRFEPYFVPVHIIAISMPTVVVLQLWLKRKRIPEVERVIWISTGIALATIGIYDVAMQLGKYRGWVRGETLTLLPYFGLIMLLGFGGALFARFLRVYRKAEQANVYLSEEIARKQGDLEASYTQRTLLQQERAVALERERLVREMHDGMGGHLVGLLAMVERRTASPGELADGIRDALDDMRLVIHSLEPSAMDIPGLLAGLKARLEPRLRSQGIHFRWAVQDLPLLSRMGANEVLQVMRIVQESITNAIKHAHPRRITVRTGVSKDQKYIYLEVEDDGKGIDPSAREGLGLGNLRKRAETLEGEIDIESGSDGTTVQLRIHVERWA